MIELKQLAMLFSALAVRLRAMKELPKGTQPLAAFAAAEAQGLQPDTSPKCTILVMHDTA